MTIRMFLVGKRLGEMEIIYLPNPVGRTATT
jgi:hypothetical protein